MAPFCVRWAAPFRFGSTDGELHVNADYSHVEIVDDESRPTRGYGYVVGTTFHSHAMPLVRFRLTDRTRWKPGHIRKSQVAQVGPASWEVRVVPMPGFCAADQQYLVDNIRHLVDPLVAVKVVLKDDLPNTAAGKFRWVVNEFHPPGNAPE